jgi:1-acyl-sn-glycerol-3-phosphate acyltransferase
VTLAHRVVTSTIRGLLRLLCRVDDTQLARVPDQGPLIVVSNHINFLEVPLLFTHLWPRPVTGFVKVETWDNPALRFLADLWGAIPLQRGEADMAAFRAALRALDEGQILVIAPEGTRSGHGRLLRGKAGLVLLARRTSPLLLPMVHYGGETFWDNLRCLRRTSFRMVVGQPFHLDAGGVKVTAEVRQQMVDEIMYQLAALLPPPYRGVYADLAAATETYLRFPPGSQSNLPAAQ